VPSALLALFEDVEAAAAALMGRMPGLDEETARDQVFEAMVARALCELPPDEVAELRSNLFVPAEMETP
jgi:hypothetical protein